MARTRRNAATSKVAAGHAPDWPKSAVRVVFGIIWLIDALLKWPVAFEKEYLDLLTDAAKGQPGWLAPWFKFWIALVAPRVPFFYRATALLETLIALALILGFARKLTYIAAAGFSLLIWSTAEGFGGPYTPGATDIGTGLIYAIVFFSLLALNAQFGTSRYSLDASIERHWLWWRHLAEARGADVRSVGVDSNQS